MKIYDILEAGHWEVAPIDYPNNILKKKDRPKKGRLSFLVDPKDRDAFFKKKKKPNPTASKW